MDINHTFNGLSTELLEYSLLENEISVPSYLVSMNSFISSV